MIEITYASNPMSLIFSGNNIYINYFNDNVIFVFFKYDPIVIENLKYIPSYRYIKSHKCSAIHYLDLRLLESIADNIGYKIFTSKETIDQISKIKEKYLFNLRNKNENNIKINENREFRPYQLIGSQFMFHAKNAINADCVGSGKTTQAIGAIVLNKLQDNPYKTLIVCPSSVKGAWYNEIKSVTFRLNPILMDSNINKRYDQYQNLKDVDVLIMSYDSFIKDYGIMKEYFIPNIVIIDEAHRLVNRQNKITQILIGGQSIKKTFKDIMNYHSIYLLTGTPIVNKIDDLYAILKAVDPYIFTLNSFRLRYTKEMEFRKVIKTTGKEYKFRKVVGYKNQNELKNKAKFYMIRRLRDEILNQLPDKSYKIYDIELSDEERAVYNKLKEDFKVEFRGKEITVNDKLSWMTRAQQICNSLETLPESPSKNSSKLKELLQIVSNYHEEHKIVIFSKYTSVTDILERELKHLHPLHLKGEVKDTDRTKIIKAFQENEKHRIFLSTYGAGGAGITLTAADICILYDLAWTPSMNAQAIGRLDRIGQKNNINIFILKVINSIEDHMFNIVWNKQNLIDNIISDEKNVLARIGEMKIEELL